MGQNIFKSRKWVGGRGGGGGEPIKAGRNRVNLKAAADD